MAAEDSADEGSPVGVGAGVGTAALAAAPTAPRIGLALSSGGARGFAHIGVIKALREAGFTIVNVAGSSMGGIIAAGYAARADVDELERWAHAFRARDYTRPLLPVMDPARLTAFLDDLLSGRTFAECAVPLRIVATDLRERAATTLDEGSVALAAFASSAMPFLHRPVPWQGRLLADGSLSCVLPLAQAEVPGVDLIVGSLVSRRLPPLGGLAGGLAKTAGGLVRGWSRPYAEFFREWVPQLPWPTAEAPAAPPTIVLTPLLERVGVLDFGRMRDAIAAGEEAVAEKLDELRALIHGDTAAE